MNLNPLKAYREYRARVERKEGERRERVRQIVAFYHDRGLVVPPCMFSHLRGGRYYSPSAVSAEFLRIAQIKRREEKAKQGFTDSVIARAVTYSAQDAAQRNLRVR